MTPLACLLLLAAATSVELVDEVYNMPPADWKYVEVNLRQQPALVIASFNVDTGSDKVRLAFMSHADLERMREEIPHGLLAATALGKSGGFQFRVRQPGDYAVIVDNRSGTTQAAAVHLRIALDFARSTVPVVTFLSPQRQFTVIVLAFAFFFGVVTWSARILLRSRAG